METTKSSGHPLLLGSSVSFACAVAAHTFMVLREGDAPRDSGRVLLITALAAGCALAVALPFGALLRTLPRRFGRGGSVVAWGAVVVSVGLVFASQQALLAALGEGELVGFVTTGWLWDLAGWGGSVLYLLTVPIDLLLMFTAAIMQGVAVFVVPPASGLCCGFGWVLVALPFLFLLRRRRSS